MFQPYHEFGNCKRLENKIEQLYDSGQAPNHIYRGFCRYHFALIFKLRCAKYHIDCLKSILNNPPNSDAIDTISLMHDINMHFDGFLYSVNGALDILSREILTYFDIQYQGDFYFTTARTQLTNNRAGDVLIDRLDTPAWKEEFSEYRNVSTHELLIAIDIQLSIRHLGNTRTTKIKVPLPDNPRCDEETRTHNKNPDTLAYCEATFKRVLRFISPIYGDLYSRINRQGQLPL